MLDGRGSQEPSEEEVTRIGNENLDDFKEAGQVRAREALNKIREMGEQGFRNLTVEAAAQIVQACQNVRVERLHPSSALGANPSGITAEQMQAEAREAIEKLADFQSDAEPFDDAVLNVPGAYWQGRFGDPTIEPMKIRAFHQPTEEGGRVMASEYVIPFSLWNGVIEESAIPEKKVVDFENLRLIGLKQETERALHQYFLAEERLKSLSINPAGGEKVFN